MDRESKPQGSKGHPENSLSNNGKSAQKSCGCSIPGIVHPVWTGLGATWSRGWHLCPWQGVEQDGFYCPLQPQLFCDSVTLTRPEELITRPSPREWLLPLFRAWSLVFHGLPGGAGSAELPCQEGQCKESKAPCRTDQLSLKIK